MARIKFSKRQIAGVLLLSSTTIGATASGTASANAFTKFIGSKVSHAYNWVTDSTVGKVVAAILLAVARVPFKVRNLWYKYNSIKFASNRKELLGAIEGLTSEINEELKDKNKKNLKEEVVEKYEQTLDILKDLGGKVTDKKIKNVVSNFNNLKQIFEKYNHYYNNDVKKLFSEIEEKYKIYTNLYYRLINLLYYELGINNKQNNLDNNSNNNVNYNK